MDKIKIMSAYRPEFCWTLGNFWERKNLDECWDEFQKVVGNKTADEYNFEQFKEMNTHWGKFPNLWASKLEKWCQIEGKQEGNLEEYVRFQTGTSKARAELFIESGQGYVETEDIMGTPDWDVSDRWFGIQISIPGVGHRSSIERLDYYASVQANRLGDKPVVLTGLIKRKYIYCQNNFGEYCISKKNYKEILSPEIMEIDEYEKKYLNKT